MGDYPYLSRDETTLYDVVQMISRLEEKRYGRSMIMHDTAMKTIKPYRKKKFFGSAKKFNRNTCVGFGSIIVPTYRLTKAQGIIAVAILRPEVVDLAMEEM